MNEAAEFPALLPVLPEIVLAVGAMVLLMVGAFRGEAAARPSTVLAILLLVAAGVIVVMLPDGRLVTFGGSFVVDGFARFLKLLALAGSAVAILMSFDYFGREKQQRFEYAILILLSTTGMLMLISAADLIALYLGLELMSLVALRGGGDRPRQRALDRGGAEILRARRAVLRHAALRRLAGLRLHRHDFVCRHRQGRRPRAASA